MPVDLIPMSSIHNPSKSADTFIQRIHSLHNEIRMRINLQNDSYKISAYSHRRFIEFQVGDDLLVRIRPEPFPQWIAKKLQARSTGPFKVLKRLGPNAYALDLPPNMGISATFNVEDRVPFRGPPMCPNNPTSTPSTNRVDHLFELTTFHNRFP